MARARGVFFFVMYPMLLVGGWPSTSLGRPIGQWAMPSRVGAFSCMDCTNHALVGGTTQGYVANFPLERNLRINITQLSDGQPLLHVNAKGSFVAGAFYDRTLGKYVVRTKDITGITRTFQTFHKTHVIGGGFMRVNSDLCYFSLAIDGVYVVSSIRRGSIIKIGQVQDLVGKGVTPTCVSSTEDGMVALGTHDKRLYFLDMKKQEVNSASGQGPFVPLAIHAIRKQEQAGSRPSYLLAWTSSSGHVCTGHTPRRLDDEKPAPVWVTGHEKVDNAPLVKIKISQQSTMTIQSDTGKTILMRACSMRERVNGAWMMPIPCMDNFVWHCNEKGIVSLLYFEDAKAREIDAMPCDS